MATIEELLQYGKEQLTCSGNEYAKYERKVLLEEALQLPYMYMMTHPSEEVAAEKEAVYRQWIERRCNHYPLQYILGHAHFMDYTFLVNESVLIPRADTEILVEQADAIVKRQMEELPSAPYRLLDLCCGSGCIGISLKLYHPKLSLTLSDISKEALAVADSNVKKYELEQVTFHCGDLLDGIKERQHMIVSNPPYIERQVIATLMPEVREHEPMLALDGGEDGLDYYRRIVEQAPMCLEIGGYLLLEIGHNQAEAVSQLMQQQGFCQITVCKDYAGLNRVVYGHL